MCPEVIFLNLHDIRDVTLEGQGVAIGVDERWLRRGAVWLVDVRPLTWYEGLTKAIAAEEVAS